MSWLISQTVKAAEVIKAKESKTNRTAKSKEVKNKYKTEQVQKAKKSTAKASSENKNVKSKIKSNNVLDEYKSFDHNSDRKQ